MMEDSCATCEALVSVQANFGEKVGLARRPQFLIVSAYDDYNKGTR